jgi:transcriptional coactivator HFI1/ADA1
MPDQGPAPWVTANDKPVAPTGSKPVSGDAAERKLKGEVMQLPARDRRRIKDLIHNDVCNGYPSLFAQPVLIELLVRSL